MQVETAHAPASTHYSGRMFYFCSDRCHDRFVSAPDRFAKPGASPERMNIDAGTVTDPVCGMTVDSASAAARRTHAGAPYYFCSAGCAETFEENPSRYARSEVLTAIDPVCGMTAEPSTAPSHVHQGQTYYFCGTGCRDSFAAEPERYLAGAGSP
jgi:YHS domain-containing protein